MPSLVEVAVKQQLEKPMTITCGQCGIVFYKGPISKYLNDAQIPLLLDYLLLPIRHVWDFDGHRIIVNFGGIDIGTVTGGDDVNSRVELAKMDLRNKGLFEFAEGKYDVNWKRHLSNIVHCSICMKPYHNIKDASHCCESVKANFSFPFHIADDYQGESE